ncbi:MAG TPA: TRAP transporter substrate-binding protein [Thermoanaerobacterales bacterium]|nr:TRAP transporter substrate-binding protein [Thermoanaerobacterales bacterium]
MFKKGLILVLVSLLILSLVGCGAQKSGGDNASQNQAPASNSGDKIVMKIAHAAKPGSARDLGAQKIKEVVEKETNGKVEVQIYPASQLGGGRDLIEGMQMGTIEMVILPSSFLGGFQPLTTIMDLPFYFPDDVNALLKVEQSEAARKLLDTTEEIGVKTMMIWHTGYKQFTANKPLTKPEDFKGLKFRTMPSPIQMEQYYVLGATPINMEFSETYNALQTGAIDGQENPLDTTYDMKFHEVQKAVTLSRHGVLDQFIMVSKTWYESLPKEIQDAIMKGVEEGQKVTLEKTYENEKKALEEFKAKGLQIVELTPEQRQAFVEATKGLRDIYVNKYGDRAAEILKTFDEAIKQATAK